MKLLSTFETLDTVTASGSDANYPVANIKDLDPMIRWHADAYSGDVWIKIDFGAATVLNMIFLNQANFAHAHVQGNATDVWTSPSFDLGVDLARDELNNRKGWFDLTAFNYRWMRILIPGSQTLDNSETVPALGNLITGQAVAIPAVSAYTPDILKRWTRFEPDGGGLIKTTDDRGRHVITLECADTLSNVRALSKTWEIGVVFSDLGYPAESWLVYPPESWSRPTRNILDATLRWSMEERP